ncbi:hypothetical protein ACWT_0958 [Actinoplanes sp. SE50]|uniref:hypothetical protein n=1 Tax=unclassified Actinoplanes TaxID=2626549 RepID=UPI00023EC729|nr:MULTISPECIES: hypothetical protein [unclassified Actinoplanes]AEV81973.1 Zinc finger and BTB domain-containing protein 17 [Actinoplanes sp. SE50/110]ATO80373.1 hypothetical protein ACWT_0958 [Actinoplanes sp. SE50]SLL97779.1 uncharacterized protein ACSP50_0988 [Actinoplanes sp. SE50/110]
MTDAQATTAAPETIEESRLTVALLTAASLAWTVAMLYSARASITGRADVAMEVTSTAYAMPGAVAAAMVTGAAVALLVLTLINGRRALGATARFAVATVSGLVTGVLCALPIITINIDGTMYAAVGGTVAAAATIGGALAGFRIPPVIAAAGAATVGVFLIGFVLNNKHVQNPVLDLLGSGSTESAVKANQYFSYGQSAISGLAAGLIAFRVLRRHRQRAGGADLRWPFYLIAGAGAGVLSVLSEILTRTAGAQVLELAGKVSELEKSVQQILSTNRLNSGLIVLFVGAFTAMVAIGRTLSPADDEDDYEDHPGATDTAPGATAPAPDAAARTPEAAAPQTAPTAPEAPASVAATGSAPAATTAGGKSDIVGTTAVAKSDVADAATRPQQAEPIEASSAPGASATDAAVGDRN